MEKTSDIQAAVEAGSAATFLKHRLEFLDAEKTIPMVLTNHGQSVTVVSPAMVELEKRRPGPRRRAGVATLTELAGFIEHLKRFKSEHTAVFADTSAMTLRAVYNYHPAGPEQEKAAWCDHGAAYTCPRSPAWLAWTAFDGQMVGQEELAELLEQRLDDLTSGKEGEGFPQPIAILEMARDLRIHTRGRFEKKFDPRTGSTSLICKEETEEIGSTPIPKAFLLGIPVFDGGDPYRVEARLRVKIDHGQPKLGYVLHRRTEIERDAFGDVRKAVAEGTGVPVLAGSPER